MLHDTNELRCCLSNPRSRRPLFKPSINSPGVLASVPLALFVPPAFPGGRPHADRRGFGPCRSGGDGYTSACRGARNTCTASFARDTITCNAPS